MDGPLADIVLPPSRGDEVFPYLTDALGGEHSPGADHPVGQPASLAQLLAQTAVTSGRTEQLSQRLDALSEQTKMPHLVELIRLQLATAQQDATGSTDRRQP